MSRPLGDDVVVMWLSLGQAYVAEGHYRRAQETAERAEAVILASMPDHVEFRAQAVLTNGVALLLTQPRRGDRIQAAHNEFSRARRLFPPSGGPRQLRPAAGPHHRVERRGESGIAVRRARRLSGP